MHGQQNVKTVKSETNDHRTESSWNCLCVYHLSQISLFNGLEVNICFERLTQMIKHITVSFSNSCGSTVPATQACFYLEVHSQHQLNPVLS